MNLTSEQIAQIATQAALAAVQAAIGGASPAIAPGETGEREEDEAAEVAAIAQQNAAAAAQRSRMIELVEELAPMVMQERHLVIFDWLCSATGRDRAEMITLILRNAIAKEAPAYREAHGKGGGSTKSAETLERLRNGG